MIKFMLSLFRAEPRMPAAEQARRMHLEAAAYGSLKGGGDAELSHKLTTAFMEGAIYEAECTQGLRAR